MKFFFLGIFAFFFSHQALASFSHESEWSSIVLKGNNDIETYNAKTTNRYMQEKYNLTFGGHQTIVRPFQNETVNNWTALFKVGVPISKHMDVYLGSLLEGNKFIGYLQRDNIDTGLVYTIIDSDKQKFRTEAGYRYTREDFVSPLQETTFQNRGRVYVEYSQEINAMVWYKLWIEYLPNFTEPENYMINYEPSLLVTLTKNLSLKTSYWGRYDNQPASPIAQYMDTTYMTSLVARF